MIPRTRSEINKAFLSGDTLTDKELVILRDFYERVTDDLALLGDHFHLAWKETYTRYRMLVQMGNARNI